MANRSYIYGLKNNTHISIGEAPYFIPYTFRVLAAYENSCTDSDLFDKKTGIKASFREGKEALYFLLDFLIATGEMKDPADFEAAAKQTKTYLDGIDADQILLENGEIYALYKDKEGNYLDGPGMEKANEYEREDAQWIGEDIRNLEAFGITPRQLFHLEDEKLLSLFESMIALKDNWKESMGLDCWRSVLYFQFSPGQ